MDYTQLYQDVYNQLKKDFHPHIAMAEAPEELNAQWLYDETWRMINEVSQRQTPALNGIINRVDISEKQMRKLVTTNSQNEKMKALTEMVLRREALKVWIRRNLST